MEKAAIRKDNSLVQAIFTALDTACDSEDIEVVRRLSRTLDRLALTVQAGQTAELRLDP